MKKNVALLGLVALSASGIQAAAQDYVGTLNPKPWSISAELRGFYDDNPSTIPNKSGTGTFGYEVTPGIGIEFDRGQTKFGLSFLYSFLYYENKPPGNVEHYDQDYTASLQFDHSFSERYKISVHDAFVIGQEPDYLRAGNTFSTFQRIPGDNIRNYGVIDFDAQITRMFSVDVGYANAYYDYSASGPSLDTSVFPPTLVASPSGLLDRLENNAHIDGRFQWKPETVLILGYAYGQTDYTGDEIIGFDPTTLAFLKSDVRNSRSQYGYAGVDQTFNPNFTASLRAGARYIDFYNDPSTQNDVSPYVLASLHYMYMVQSFAELGFSFDHTASDLFSVNRNNGSITTDATTASVWGSVTHRITPKFFGSVVGQVQDSDYNGGSYNNETDLYYLFGINFEYRFNPHFSASVGYNYDKLDSDVPGRSFDRNRVYIGAKAAY